MKGTIAIDFDGVIHKYSHGWQGGEIYDEPIEEVLQVIADLLNAGYSVFIFSTRNKRQIKKWLDDNIFIDIDPALLGMTVPRRIYDFTCEIIPFWKRFWDKRGVLGITNRKLPAIIYIDDRAYRFENVEILKNDLNKYIGADIKFKN